MRDLTPYVQDKRIRRKYLSHVAFCDHGKSCKACHWLWKGLFTKKGQGLFFLYDRSLKIRIGVIPTRFMFTLRYGHTDLQVLHTCDIPLCNNYHHLYAGTHKKNMQDRDDRHRTPKGEEHKSSKLTNEDIFHIFYLREQGYSQQKIGSMLGITSMQVSNILRGKSWKHLILDT